MDKIKINLDREKLSSEYIHSKQDFNKVQSQVSLQTSMFKSTWFYGAIGIASIAAVVFITINNSNTHTNDSNSTISKKIIIDTKQETLAERRSANVFLASVNNSTSERIAPQEQKKNIQKIDKSNVPKHRKAEIELTHTPIKVPEEVQQTFIIKKQELERSIEPQRINHFPRINGVYNGEISQSKLCGAGIDVNPSVHVLNFTIHYSTSRGDKIQLIEGNKLPVSICKEMEHYGIDQMIFITDITGTDKDGKILNFTPMNLVAVMD